ncbi:hypothetical protein ACFQZZ_27760 [Nocardia sp. GCM10030253]|uniref:hypothetical protein n=1 Tax=Nocardia sp. GCM10030253 TaxID=3273404 RepID=UPI00362DD118
MIFTSIAFSLPAYIGSTRTSRRTTAPVLMMTRYHPENHRKPKSARKNTPMQTGWSRCFSGSVSTNPTGLGHTL